MPAVPASISATSPAEACRCRAASWPATTSRTADFSDSDFSHADLRDLAIDHSNFEGSDFRQANLQQARFWKVSLRGSDWRGADLRGALLLDLDLRATQLEGARFEGACYNANTLWPDGFQIRRSGLKRCETTP